MWNSQSDESVEFKTKSKRRNGSLSSLGWMSWAKSLLCLAIFFQAHSCFAQLFLGHPSVAQEVTPVPLPDPGIPGFSFPTPEATLNVWAATDPEAVAKHGWGIWTALTMPTDQIVEDQQLLVFETWQTPADVKAGSLKHAFAQQPTPLRQFPIDRDGAAESTILGFVKYDPTAAAHIVDNHLFEQSALNQFLTDGKTKVPDFPTTSVSLKPVFNPIRTDDKNLVDGRYYKMPTWPGPPGDTLPGTTVPFPSTAWHECVWIDLESEGQGNGATDSCEYNDDGVITMGAPRTAATTYNLDDFIHFEMGDKHARLLNLQNKLRSNDEPLYQAGDPSILQAMHVTSRELTRWTWQTFWWSHQPDNPHFPSSDLFANTRPEQLQGAARNYVQSAAYSMVTPPQPQTGGQNSGKDNGIESLYSYNPYLEAGFGRSILPTSEEGYYEGRAVDNHVGIQTNCMSCHATANYDPESPTPTHSEYTGDRYVDLEGEEFDGELQVDFLWSIPDNAEPDNHRTTLVYDATNGEVSLEVEENASIDAILIESDSGIFISNTAENLGGEDDVYNANSVFKFSADAFESFSFGNIAEPGLSKEFLLNDLTSLAFKHPGQSVAGPISLAYVPEPSSQVLAGGMMLMSAWFMRRRVGPFRRKRFQRNQA